MSKSLDGVLTKKANQREAFTEAQLDELARCMNTKDGYLHFSKAFAFIQHPVQGKLLFDPYTYQVRLLSSLSLIHI